MRLPSTFSLPMGHAVMPGAGFAAAAALAALRADWPEADKTKPRQRINTLDFMAMSIRRARGIGGLPLRRWNPLGSISDVASHPVHQPDPSCGAALRVTDYGPFPTLNLLNGCFKVRHYF